MTQSSKFFVRPFKPSDDQSFLAAVLASFNELNYWLPWCHENYALADAQAWIAMCEDSWRSETAYPLGIFDAESGQVIGGAGINQIDKTYCIGEVGYWVSTPYTNRGVAQFAARQTAEMGFQKLGLTRLEIIVLTHNLASQRVAESIGAVRECVARNRIYFQDKPHDAVVYSLVPGDLVVAGS